MQTHTHEDTHTHTAAVGESDSCTSVSAQRGALMVHQNKEVDRVLAPGLPTRVPDLITSHKSPPPISRRITTIHQRFVRRFSVTNEEWDTECARHNSITPACILWSVVRASVKHRRVV